jgi:hypothetical protein
MLIRSLEKKNSFDSNPSSNLSKSDWYNEIAVGQINENNHS